MEDEKIVELYWQRSESAIGATQKKYGAYLTKIAYNILSNREDSEESVNDTYLHAWNSMPPHKPGALSSFLATITRRVSIDLFRKRTRTKRRASEYALSLDELADCASGRGIPEEELDAQLLGEAVSAFLRSQPKLVQSTFIGRYYFLDPVKTVAAYCGISESKVKNILFRTRNDLRHYLKEGGFDL